LGRPAEELEINGSQFGVIGVDLGGTKSYATITNLAGEILHEVYAEHEGGPGRDPLKELLGFIETLMRLPGMPEIWGVGVGVPGITVRPDGVVVYSPSLEWRDLKLQDLLSRHFGVRVLVDNDVNLAALGEWEFGAGKGAQSLVYITIGTGIGAGIVLDGQIYRGFNHAAGEIGHLIPGVGFLGRRYEQFGALEQIASGHGLGELARRALAEQGIAVASDRIGAEAADHLAVAIAAISTVLNPEVVVLGGGVMKSGHALVDLIRQRLDGAIPYVPRIELSTIGYRAGALGAIAFVLDMTTGQVRLRRSH
jgi:predicted NBD/HSP70 family sugar kinase